MATIDELLGVDPNDPRETLAASLVEEHENLLSSLVNHRVMFGLTQREVGDIIGVSQATISDFERSGNDPRLSTIRRYALAIGVKVHHWVSPSQSVQTVSRAATSRPSTAAGMSDADLIRLTKNRLAASSSL